MAASQNAQTARNYANSREVAIEAAQQREHERGPGRAAQPGRVPDRPDPAGPVQPAGLLRHAGRRPAHRLPARRSPRSASARTASCSRWPRCDGSLRLWNVASPGRPGPRPAADRPGCRLPLYTTAFSPDGTAAGRGRRRSARSGCGTSTEPAPARCGGPPLTRAPAGRVYTRGVQPRRPPARGGQRGQHGPAVGHPEQYAAPRRRWPRPPRRPATWSRWRSARTARLLAAGSADGTVRLWPCPIRPQPGRVGRPLPGPRPP